MVQKTTPTPKPASNGKTAAVGVAGGVTGAVAAILAAVFAVEGGYVNNPKDPGGATNHGVTEVVARKHGYEGHMRNLPKEFAEKIYFEDYVVKPNFHLVVEASPAVGQKLVDAGVNIGPVKPSRWFQLSLNALNRGGVDYPSISVDGRVGPSSVSAYRSLERVRGRTRACELVLKLLDVQQGQHYLSLTHLNTFTVGWIDHRIGNVPLTKCKEF